MESKAFNYILFDLDGTLVDSVPDLAYCVDVAMAEAGLPARGSEAVRQWVGNGIEKLVKRAVVNGMEGDAEPVLFNRAYQAFLTAYTAHHATRSQVYDGVLGALERLKQQGYRMACVTNKAQAFTLPLLQAKGLSEFFDVVVSGDTCAHKKPHPEPLEYALAQLGGNASEALMIGDSKSDIQAARAAGLAVYALPYGYNHGEDIQDYHPDKVIHSLAELPEVLATHQ